MEAAEYKTLCQQFDVFGRFLLEETAWLMPANSRLRSQLHAILNEGPIAKPDLYKSEICNDDHFKVNLSVPEAEEITSILISHEAEAISANGETTGRASSIAGLVDTWQNYVEGKID
jgi:hypothetical protein